jgi:O-antigen/teichoic acid export membrane protein
MIKKTLKNSSIYIFAEVLNKALPFFMLPVLTRYLTPEDYGVIAIFGALVSLLAVFVGVSTHGAVNVNYFQMKKDELKRFISNVIILLNITTAIALLFVLIFSPWLIEKLQIPFEWLVVAVFVSLSQFLTTLNLTLWIAEEESKKYSLYQIFQTLVTLSITLVLVVGIGMQWEGQLLAMTIGKVLFGVMSVLFIVKRGYFLFSPNKTHIKDALKFGVPLIPHALSGWIRMSLDRVVLMSLVGSAVTGIYTVGFQLAMVVSIVALAFNKAWSPYVYKILSDNPIGQSKRRIVKFTYIYFVGIVIFAWLFSMAIEKIIFIFVDESFLDAVEYVLPLSFAFAFQGMYFMVSNYIFFVKKTPLLAYVTFVSAFVHIILLGIFVQMYGPVGAAYASVVSFFLTFVLTWILANRVYEMPWNLFKADGVK